MKMNYPLLQWDWNDSEPLTMVAETYPELGLESTAWYQWQLGLLMMAPAEPNHPWLTLPPHREEILNDEAERQNH